MVDLAKQGDQKAITELISRWTPSVERFATRLCPTTEVLDAVQESLLILSTRIRQLRSANALVSWLFMIVKRQCHRAFASMRHDIAIAKAMQDFGSENRYFGPHELLMINEMSGALGRLEDTDRALVIQKDIEGLGLAEMAAERGLSVGALKSRLSRARRSLRNIINN